MIDLINSHEFQKLEKEYKFLRHAREAMSGLKALSAVFVDTETTGLEPAGNEIIEIAGLKIINGEVADVFNSLINIHKPLPPEIIRLTGINDEMLAEGEEKASVLRKFIAFIGELPLIAHNVEFDLPFINHQLNNELGFTLPNPAICTLKISRRIIPGLSSYKLGKLAEHFKLPAGLSHRALGDVETTHQVWLKLTELLESAGVHNLEGLLKFT